MNSSFAVTLRELQPADLDPAAQLLGRGMSENPVNLRAFAITDAARRQKALARFFRPVLSGIYRRGLIYGAFRDEVLLGVCGIARPGFCQPAVLEKLSIVPAVALGNPRGTTFRILRWAGDWARHDPRQAHWHLGPVAVDPRFWSRGIGSAMLTALCGHMDAYGTCSYLETDRRENIRFYQRFHFEVVSEIEVLGVPNWFMLRCGRA
jgi:ribosomal protein S18 acetylase RimI-like enzyme